MPGNVPGGFIDTNVLVYLLSDDAPRVARARQIVADRGVVSVQVLNELANVARRKLHLPWSDVHHLLGTLRALLDVVPLTVDIHDAGLRLAERHGFSTYDAMIVAAASLHGCETLWSQDMQHDMLIDGRLRIRDPFRSGP
jgi:predicted nucleic acid-binding protein